ncbi:MAG: RnfH family protein [Steroidobacteraceae bacterium]
MNGVSPGGAAMLSVAFAYASPQVQYWVELPLPAGATAAALRKAAREALEAGQGTLQVTAAAAQTAGSERAAALAEIPWQGGECGNFSQPIDWQRPLQEGDRVEILRPLQVDPRVSRRNRVAAARRKAPGPWRPVGGPDGGSSGAG